MENFRSQLATVVGFFTRFPLPRSWIDSQGSSTLSSAASTFPLAGLIVAVIPAVIWFISAQFLPSLVAAGLAITSGLVATGALHEDGLADCADGFGATSDRKKILEIMRDSQIGTFGGLALIASVGLRWAALASFTASTGFFALLICHSGARSTILLAMQFSRYTRPEGLGNSVEGEMPKHALSIAFSVATAIAVFLGGIPGLIALVAGAIAAWLMLKLQNFRLGGYTGDGLGAMEQVAEITILIVLAGFWT